MSVDQNPRSLNSKREIKKKRDKFLRKPPEEGHLKLMYNRERKDEFYKMKMKMKPADVHDILRGKLAEGIDDEEPISKSTT